VVGHFLFLKFEFEFAFAFAFEGFRVSQNICYLDYSKNLHSCNFILTVLYSFVIFLL
jgi:hypothetical protein